MHGPRGSQGLACMRGINEFQAGPVLPQSVISSGNGSFTQHGQNPLTEQRDSFVRLSYIRQTSPFETAPGISTYQRSLVSCCVVFITCPLVQHCSVPSRLAPWHKNWNLTALFVSNAVQIVLGIPTYQRHLVTSCVVSIAYLPVQHRSIRSRVAPLDKNC